jgi:hypothetical protein
VGTDDRGWVNIPVTSCLGVALRSPDGDVWLPALLRLDGSDLRVVLLLEDAPAVEWLLSVPLLRAGLSGQVEEAGVRVVPSRRWLEVAQDAVPSLLLPLDGLRPLLTADAVLQPGGGRG